MPSTAAATPAGWRGATASAARGAGGVGLPALGAPVGILAGPGAVMDTAERGAAGRALGGTLDVGGALAGGGAGLRPMDPGWTADSWPA